MSQTLRELYEILIDEFTKQNTSGDKAVNIGAFVSEPGFVETKGDRGLLSLFYTKKEGGDTLVVHQYCYDRCRVHQVLPDGNRITVTLTVGGKTEEKIFEWLDRY